MRSEREGKPGHTSRSGEAHNSFVGDQIKRDEPSEVLLKHLLPEEGWYIINVRQLFDLPGYRGFGYFRFLEPVDRIGNSLHIYWIDEDALQTIADVIHWASRRPESRRASALSP